jgi:tRNA 2-thiouridine synthesizing protein A
VADFDLHVDATGLDCPMPILRSKKALAGMQSGEVIYITATDPGSVKDFTGFARMTGHELLESREEEGVFHFLIRKV